MPRLGRALRDQLALGRFIGDNVPGLTTQRITERGEGRQVNGVAQRPALRLLQRWAGAFVAGDAARRGALARADGAVRGRGAVRRQQHRAVQLAGRPPSREDAGQRLPVRC